jgi:hypothetical protein
MEPTNNNKAIEFIGGLRPTPRDKRDFSLGAIVPQWNITSVPNKDFLVGDVIGIKSQKLSDFCTGFSVCAVSELQEGMALNPCYQFAKIKQIEGSYAGWGANLRSAAKSVCDWGSIEADKGYTVEEQPRDFLANWANWTGYDTDAEKHKKRSYVSVDGQYDFFTNIRIALWQFRDEKRGIIVGTTWRPSWTYAEHGIVPKAEDTNYGFGHAIAIIGQKMIGDEPYLVIQNSYGEMAGDKGFYYFPKEVVNKEFAPYGAYMFIDMPKEEVKKKAWSLRMRITEWIKNHKICKPFHV